MNTGRRDVAGGNPRRPGFGSGAQPYYIVVPDSGRKSVSVNPLHKLCSALNALGCEAYLDAKEASGDLWTPLLTEATQVAHYKAGKKPIVVSAAPMRSGLKDLGLQVKYLRELTAQPDASAAPALIYLQASPVAAPLRSLLLPLVEPAAMDAAPMLPSAERQGVAYLQAGFVKAGGQARVLEADAVDLDAPAFDSEAQAMAQLCRVRLLVAYEDSIYTDLARLCGCPVVLMPNAFTLKKHPLLRGEWDLLGLAWGDSPEAIAAASASVARWRVHYLQQLSAWQHSLQDFVEETQAAALALSVSDIWPPHLVDALDIPDLSPAEQGARADRKKYRRLNEQYERWTQFCTLREVDADIYAEYLAAGKVPAVCVVIDQRGCSMDALADTLDSLGECLWRPAHVLILSDQSAPQALEPDSGLHWLHASDAGSAVWQPVLELLTDWTLVVHSGTRLAPQSLVEWGLATQEFAQAQLIYADDDVWQGGKQASHYPFFKPDANIELLRCTNYLGNALLVRTAAWQQAGYALFDGGLYAMALQALQQQGRSALGHVDTVLVHARAELAQATEAREFDACSAQMRRLDAGHKVRPLQRLGTWLVEYPAPSAPCVTLVVPTGQQTGYLRTMLEALERFPQPALAEVVLVCQPDQREEVDYVLASISVPVPVRILALEQAVYNHAAALNAGVAQVATEFVLVCDDDTEALHANWLGFLLGIAQQSDVGCVSPRLMSNRGTDARVSGGPLVLGVNGAAQSYTGESGLLDEAGVQSRLQLTQDVGAVAGHCFVFRKADWAAVQGFDAQQFGLLFGVLDFCLRLGALGKRHVWTPLASVLHQGGKTLELALQDGRKRLHIADCEMTERDNLLRMWSRELARDASYNRHLSLMKPFDIEQTIVVDWQPRRHDRPRVLACPLTSGSGQYRVVEPLNMLQSASLAQTCAIIPNKRRESRILQPLELVRAAPDRLILQHSVNDGQAGMIDKYRIVMPDIPIIQMVDDLLGEVPAKHPNRNFQVREGHQRMAHVLKKSNRLVVTTETLKQHYQKYVPDVWLIPNCLDAQWSGLRKPKAPRSRLRIGWIGAGQHHGDLEMITSVVQTLAPEVDWIFMGMCTDAIKPHIKEYHDFVPIGDYPRKMASLDLDIAIAPIEKNIFNECKSNLRLLEYGAMGWPVVCSDVFPYQSYDPPVLRCSNDPEEWLAALRQLMGDEALRLRMGEQLHQWVQSHFLLKDKAQDWMHAIFGPTP